MNPQASCFNLAGITCHELRNRHARVWCLPALGTKIVRLEDAHNGRDWLWHAGHDLEARLRQYPFGHPFESGPMAGIDECIPTVAPCPDHESPAPLPDHGEAWTQAWHVDDWNPQELRLVTSLRLATRPLTLTRTLQLIGPTLHLRYRITNHAPHTTHALWALHPLLRLRDGDRLEGIHPGPVQLEAVSGSLCNYHPPTPRWPQPIPGIDLDQLDLGGGQRFIKLFVPLAHAAVRLVGGDGAGLTLRWGPAEQLPWLGVWLTRGGWHGHHHLALEPTNAPHDRLDHAPRTPANTWPPLHTKDFHVRLELTR